jgi:thiosulfate dehydrogenase [quinone] large subunit
MDTYFSKFMLMLTRVSLGWLMFYAGITKVTNPNWSAAFYLKGAKTFSGFYEGLLGSSLLPVVNFINAWGLTLLGISLIVGLGVRLSSILGAVLMILYYFPILSFPYAGEHSYIVDDHIIYALILIFFAAVRAGRVWGLDSIHKIKWFG